MAATTIPITAAPIDRMLIKPPRILEDKAMITPMIPKKIATKASTNPQKAPEAKLQIAATRAIKDGTLKLACPVDVVVSIAGNLSNLRSFASGQLLNAEYG